MATECYNRGHAATFPVALPSWFIKLLTEKGDTVLDPFAGSGTTGVAAKQTGRQWIGIDAEEAFVKLAQERIESVGAYQEALWG